jgi:hypothetical protein
MRLAFTSNRDYILGSRLSRHCVRIVGPFVSEQGFGGTYRFHLQDRRLIKVGKDEEANTNRAFSMFLVWTLKVRAMYSSETSGCNLTAQRCNSHDYHFY